MGIIIRKGNHWAFLQPPWLDTPTAWGAFCGCFHLASAACTASTVDGLLLQRSHSEYKMFKANGWFLCLSVYSPAALLDKAGTSCRGSLAVRQSVRGEEEADGKTQLCMNEKLVWLHILADLLTLITHSPSAASDPNFSLPRGFFLLPSSIWAVCLTFHGLGQHLYMLLTGRQAQRPYIRSAGVDAVMFLCFLPLYIHITVSSASTNSPFISQVCQQALGLHTVCGNPPACRKAQILAFRLTCVSCTMGGGGRWGRREPCLGVFSWPKRCWRNLQWYLSGFPFACLLFFFFFWLSCSSLLIYCICSRGFGKGGSEGVLLPKGKGAGRRSYFTSQVM